MTVAIFPPSTFSLSSAHARYALKALQTLEAVDFLITPTTPFAAPPVHEVDVDDVYFRINGLCLRNTARKTRSDSAL